MRCCRALIALTTSSFRGVRVLAQATRRRVDGSHWRRPVGSCSRRLPSIAHGRAARLLTRRRCASCSPLLASAALTASTSCRASTPQGSLAGDLEPAAECARPFSGARCGRRLVFPALVRLTAAPIDAADSDASTAVPSIVIARSGQGLPLLLGTCLRHSSSAPGGPAARRLVFAMARDRLLPFRGRRVRSPFRNACSSRSSSSAPGRWRSSGQPPILSWEVTMIACCGPTSRPDLTAALLRRRCRWPSPVSAGAAVFLARQFRHPDQCGGPGWSALW